MSNVYAKPEELWSFVRGTDEAIFLFDDAVSDYLFDLYKQAVQLEYLGKRIEQEPVGSARNSLTEKERDLLTWFTDQFAVLRDKFIPFMRA